ncbi:MAG: cation:proton antiporter [Defluviitaleaceae bacterium]|nr:cation:proton antiporter [Defluviitaleaceae bacterium]MCL2275453.1 cation:proton antiporter [Defluviitaleaceae bacterium]
MFDIDLLLFIAIILFSTKVLAIFMKRIHLPQVVGALIAGVLLGPAVFGLIAPNEVITAIAEFGVILLLFTAGMETDFKELKHSIKSSFFISFSGVALALGGGFLVAFAFGKPSFESFFIGVVIASMSTSITVEVLQEMGKLKTRVGTSLMGASLFDDILVIVLLAVLMGMGGAGEFSVPSLLILLLKIGAFFAFAIVTGILINKLFNYMHSHLGERRRLTIFAIAYCFAMAYLAELFGLADITGAYIAGIALCSTRCVETLETKTHGLSYMFFTPIFLANIGIHTSFDGLTGSLILFTVFLIIAAVLSKLIGCGLAARLCGFTQRESLQVGTGMIARGEVSFIVAAKGIAVGYISTLIFPSIIVVVLVTVLIAPLLLKLAFGENSGKKKVIK